MARLLRRTKSGSGGVEQDVCRQARSGWRWGIYANTHLLSCSAKARSRSAVSYASRLTPTASLPWALPLSLPLRLGGEASRSEGLGLRDIGVRLRLRLRLRIGLEL